MISRIFPYAYAFLLAFYMTSSNIPLWTSCVFGLIALAAVWFNRSGIQIHVFVFLPGILFLFVILLGLTGTSFLHAFPLLALFISLVVAVRGESFSAVLANLFIVLYASFAPNINRVVDVLVIGTALMGWYFWKTHKFSTIWFLAALCGLLLVAGIISDNHFSVINPVSERISKEPPLQDVQNEQKTRYDENRIVAVDSVKTSVKTSGKSSAVASFVEKIWMPLFLSLATITIAGIVLRYFGLKRTVKLFLLGLVLFSLVIAGSRVILSAVDALRSESIQNEGIAFTDGSSSLPETSPDSTSRFSEKKMQTLTLKTKGVLTFFDIAAMGILILVTGFLVYYAVGFLKNARVPSEASEEGIPEDVVILPIDEIPSFECSKHAIFSVYWWIRRKYYSGKHHLTPNEILDVQDEPNKELMRITEIYTKLRYAGQKLTDRDCDVFKKSFLSFVSQKEQYHLEENPSA